MIGTLDDNCTSSNTNGITQIAEICFQINVENPILSKIVGDTGVPNNYQ